MTAATQQFVAVVRVGNVTRFSVTVTHATTADADVSHRVEKLSKNIFEKLLFAS